MKIYRIYKIIYDVEWDYYNDDFIDCTDCDKEETIKYVDSIEKVDAFLKGIEDGNNSINKCTYCPIINFTKRQYNNGKHDVVINEYCDSKDISFIGNTVKCNNDRSSEYDCSDYYYEEIEVE